MYAIEILIYVHTYVIIKAHSDTHTSITRHHTMAARLILTAGRLASRAVGATPASSFQLRSPGVGQSHTDGAAP